MQVPSENNQAVNSIESQDYFFVEAIYAFKAETKDEMNLMVGERATVEVGKWRGDSNEWYYAYHENGLEGWIPINFVKQI